MSGMKKLYGDDSCPRDPQLAGVEGQMDGKYIPQEQMVRI